MRLLDHVSSSSCCWRRAISAVCLWNRSKSGRPWKTKLVAVGGRDGGEGVRADVHRCHHEIAAVRGGQFSMRIAAGRRPLLRADGLVCGERLGVSVVDQFEAALFALPAWPAADFEAQAFLMAKAVLLFEFRADGYLEAAPLAEFERVLVGADDGVEFASAVVFPVSRRTWLVGDVVVFGVAVL